MQTINLGTKEISKRGILEMNKFPRSSETPGWAYWILDDIAIKKSDKHESSNYRQYLQNLTPL